MAPSSGMTRLQHMLNHPHSQPQKAGAPPPTTRSQSLVDVGRSLKQLVQDEWARSSHSRDEDPLPPPLRPQTGSSQRSSSVPSRRSIPPVFAGPKPAYLPPSPPLSPETPQMGFAPPPGPPPQEEKVRGSAIETEDEEAAMRVAMQASLRDAPQVPHSRPSTLPSRSAYLPRLSFESDPDPPPSFLPTDSALSSYPPEKALLFPQGRPSLPPGAAAAWDDESREMEMLALAIRMSEEEERERRRLEEREVEEVVRRIEGESASGSTSTGGSTDEEGSSTGHEGRKKGRRRSWVQPPLASSLSRTSSPPLPPTVPAQAPPRPAPRKETMSAATMASYRTAPETPFSNLMRIGSAESQSSATSATHPPPPRRAPPPPPAPQRLPPTPPDTPQVPQSATLPAPPAVPPRPYPPPGPSSASSHHLSINTDSTRGSGSPLEMPYLSPSSSLRSSNRAEREARPAIAGFFDEVVEVDGAERERRVSGTTSRSFDEEEEGLTSALSVRNPDSRQSTLSSTTSTSSSSSSAPASATAPNPDPTWDPSDLPVFPSASMGISAYANRSMSAIDEATEPASSIGGGGEESRQGSFPSTVSVEPAEGTRSEGEWLKGLDGEGVGGQVGRSPEPTAGSSLDTPTTPVAPPPPRRTDSATPIPPVTHADGMRFGYPAECAHQLGHVCPQDGLSNQGAVPETIDLATSASSTGENRDSWAIEAQSWVALLRSLMWYGDTTVVASSADVSASASARCAANASLEFRPDDEGLPVVRLVISLVPSHESTLRLAAHRELSVQKVNVADSSAKGKGKARASTTAPQMTFHLPDVLHLPTRLSSLAIQLYSLRHLASIARATQPAKSPPPPSLGSSGEVEGYAALRELADAIALLAKAAQDRQSSAPASSSGAETQTSAPQTPSPFAGTSTAPGGAGHPPMLGRATREDQAERLIDRLRDRLRRLKRSSPAPTSSVPPSADGSSADYDDEHARPSFTSRFSSTQHGSTGADGRTRLVKPPPPSRVTQVPRSERVLIAQANDEVARAPPEVEQGGTQGGTVTPRAESERPPLPPRDTRRSEQAGRARSGSVPTEMRYMPVLGAR
uniref:BY PROTMAP: gi/472588163/gb/EMS25635.1/ ubiquitin interacting motif protein [Rhodosporidium toruloides NP11] gi/647395950/emb/CDR37881.1/ RHTO0S03e00606g1_1 [Rhodosporidium toruloides] n=1 Tax=Rhodotorula toruloides TaxID=5286 RepID=A0A0K3CIN6_RHOTO